MEVNNFAINEKFMVTEETDCDKSNFLGNGMPDAFTNDILDGTRG